MQSILQVVYHLLRIQKKTSDPIESNICITVVNTSGLNIGLTLFRIHVYRSSEVNQVWGGGVSWPEKDCFLKLQYSRLRIQSSTI